MNPDFSDVLSTFSAYGVEYVRKFAGRTTHFLDPFGTSCGH
jgi:hypothetical protein